nr:switch 2 [Ipomoea batatas]
MSLNAFKEALKPCNNQSSSNSSQTSLISTQFDSSTVNPRKPPKSSLSRQLLLLEDSFTSSSWTQSQRPQKQTNSSIGVKDEKEEEEAVEEEKPLTFGRSKLESFVLDHTGPYEPLVLSPPGETPVVQVPASINCRLLEHQRVGVKFLYGLYWNNHGGVLGDDMGLGKTIQTIAFLAAVYGKDADVTDSTSISGDLERKGPVLVVCPTSVIHNWENEFSKWATFSVYVHHGPNRELIIEKLERYGVEIIITSFDTYRIHGSILSDVQWEIVIVDEAHRLKNDKSKLYQACLEIKTKKRYGLTGTIMQNKIMELFSLFDWVVPGCLGTREHFREFYEDPLKHGQRSTASNRLVQVADERKQHLVSVLQKYLLRRTKEETIGHLMLGKEDNVVFCAMSALQKRVYQRILQLPDIQCLINKDNPCSCGSPLKQVECCKRIVPDGIIWPYLHRDNPDGCDSCPFCLVLPCLVKLQQVSNHLELIKPNPRDDPDKQRKDAEFAAAVFGPDIDLVGGNTQNESFMGLSDVKHCGKMRALEKLMFTWISQGDKILLFSYSVRMLDILEKFLIRKGYCFSRLDGSTPTGLRQSLVDDFNSSPSKQATKISWIHGNEGAPLLTNYTVFIFSESYSPRPKINAQHKKFDHESRVYVYATRLSIPCSLQCTIPRRSVYFFLISFIFYNVKRSNNSFLYVETCTLFHELGGGRSAMFWFIQILLFTNSIFFLNKEYYKAWDGHASACRRLISLDSTLAEALYSCRIHGTISQLLYTYMITFAYRRDEMVRQERNEEQEGEFPLKNRGSCPDQMATDSAVILDRLMESRPEIRDLIECPICLVLHYNHLGAKRQCKGIKSVEKSKWVTLVTQTQTPAIALDYYNHPL